MSKGRPISEMLKPLSDNPIQAYLGNGLHTLGLLHWILNQTGKADVWVSSYSTSEPFLNGFVLLKQQGKVGESMILLDQRAVKKTIKLIVEMKFAFNHVFLGQNHSKIILVKNKKWNIAVVTSQNQTYGARAESTIITTDKGVFNVIMQQFIEIAGKGAVELQFGFKDEKPFTKFRNSPGASQFTGFAEYVDHQIEEDNRRRSGEADNASHDTRTDWRPIGV